MKENAKIQIDLWSLQAEAERSDGHEAFKPLSGAPNCRVGVGSRLTTAKKPTFFVEVLVNLCREHQPLDLRSVENHVILLKQLRIRGYTLNCEEDGCISCELVVRPDKVFEECRAVTLLTEECTQPRRNELTNNVSRHRESTADKGGE